MKQSISGLFILVCGARTLWLCTKYPGSSVDGWALSISGVLVMILGVYHMFGLPLGVGRRQKDAQ